jgi:universal stress protein E
MKILCATDLLSKSDSAIDRAGMLADHLGADLLLLHAVSASESDRMQEGEMLRASELLSSRMSSSVWRFNPRSKVYVRAGSPTRVLIQTMRELQPDLIVLGRHRRSAWDYVVGTMVTRILSEHKCPVLIVDNIPRDAYRNILLALDGTKVSLDALRVAEALVVKDGVRATIVHACRSPYDGALSSIGIAGDVVPRYSGEWTYDARSALRALLMNASNDFARYDLVADKAGPVATIQRVVRRLNPDLLVLGSHGRRRLGRALFGSVANRVMRTAGCDCLVVPDQSINIGWRAGRDARLSLNVVSGA